MDIVKIILVAIVMFSTVLIIVLGTYKNKQLLKKYKKEKGL